MKSLIATLLFAIALAEIRIKWILREKADCKQPKSRSQELRKYLISTHCKSERSVLTLKIGPFR